MSENTSSATTVIEREREFLQIEKDSLGLSFSGGGIRSASFGLGVMQALVNDDTLKEFHYMSTVSGGGYLGAALTWALHQKPESGTRQDNFPLGDKGQFSRDQAPVKPGQNEPKAATFNRLDFIRQHGNYLLPEDSLGVISFGAVVFRGILLSLSIYFGILLVSITACKHIWRSIINSGLDIQTKYLTEYGFFFTTAAFFLGLYILLSIFYSLFSFWDKKWLIGYKRFINGQRIIGILWQLILVFVVLGTIPHVAKIPVIGDSIPEAAGGTSIVGTLFGIWQYIKSMQKESNSKPTPDFAIYLAAFGLIYGLTTLAYHFAGVFFDKSSLIGNNSNLWFWFLTFLLLVLSVVVNLNHVGPHRIYRNRLMEAFMPDLAAVNNNQWKPAHKADGAAMKDMCKVTVTDENGVFSVKDAPKKPYHIINTNIILTNADQVKYRGRGGDNFIISPLYCGSDSTTWVETKDYKIAAGSDITLATAMATSGAAFNPSAAVSGEGITRNKVLSLLLSILNLRLGLWAVNPRKKDNFFPPNYLFPGIWGEIMRFGYREDSNRIMLSDGGHFENLGIYELIRRKSKIILASDGGADPGFNFDDLANAVEKVRVDFGANIFVFKNELDEKDDCSVNSILFSSSGTNEFQKKYEIVKRGYAIFEIIYSDGSEGLMFYVKLAMIDELPTDVYSYKGINPDFPHQSTADQFFDEKQFEAYRELGYGNAKEMLRTKLWKEKFKGSKTPDKKINKSGNEAVINKIGNFFKGFF